MSNIDRAVDMLLEEDSVNDMAVAIHHETYLEQRWVRLKEVCLLHNAGLITPSPQIIRTVQELEALDPDTVVLPANHRFPESAESLLYMFKDPFADEYVDIPLPAVVVASGERVRACREALEGETT